MARLRMLVVEGDGDVREAIARAMADVGAEVVVARDGAEALAALRSGPRPSVILLDCRLPRLGCEELLRQVRSDPGLEQVPVITMSGDACGARGEVVAHLQRPLDVADLRQIVLSLFEEAA